MITRLSNLSKTHSFFLFGPRATGKTTLLEEQFIKSFNETEVYWVNLLDPEKERDLTLKPMNLLSEIEALDKKPQFIVIDEIQKISKLLDIIHLGIQ